DFLSALKSPIIFAVDLPTTEIIEPIIYGCKDLVLYCTGLSPFNFAAIRLHLICLCLYFS
ncbi:hypothetical protein DDV23_08665, partial [Streptococcus chenjunshii]